MAHLFVLDLTYVGALEEVDAHLEAHRAYLRRNYDAGTFLASGRKEPRTGGVILATGERDEIERIVATDPFRTSGVAEYHITEFMPTMTGPQLAGLAERP